MESNHIPEPVNSPHGGARRRFVLLLTVIVLTALLAAGVLPRLRHNRELAADAQEVRTDAQVVSVVSATPGANANDITLPGSIQAIEETTISARASGYLRRRLVDIGSRVKAGDLLAEIESPEVDQQVSQAQADTAKSQAGSAQAEADVARLEAGVMQSHSELARQQANLKQAKAAQSRAEAKVLQANAALATAQAKLTQAEQNLEGQRARLNQSRAQLTIAEKTWQRWKELVKGGAVSQQEVDEKESNYESTKAGVASASSAVRAAQADLTAAQTMIKSSQADIDAAQADVEASKQTVAAAQSAVNSSQANIAAAKASVRAGRANVLATQAAIQSSNANTRRYTTLQSFSRVTAPFTGVITSRNVDTGALINAGSSGAAEASGSTPRGGLFGIARTDTLRIQVSVPQTFVQAIKPGQAAQVFVREFSGRTFQGTVFRTAGALDSNSRTLLTEVRVPNADNLLLPGMYAQVRFVMPQAKPLLHVPSNAIYFSPQGPQIAIVTDAQKIHLQKIDLGRDYGAEFEVLHGLTGQEKLVTNPGESLQEGTPVKIAAPPKPNP